jgi:hypothetical protein
MSPIKKAKKIGYNRRWRLAHDARVAKEGMMTEEEKTYRAQLQEVVAELSILRGGLPMLATHEVMDRLRKLEEKYTPDETPAPSPPPLEMLDLPPEMKAALSPNPKAVRQDEQKLMEIREDTVVDDGRAGSSY